MMLHLQFASTIVLLGVVTRHTTCLELNSVNANIPAAIATLTTIEGLNATQGIANNHICTREETYIEQIPKPATQQVRVRTSNWCLEIPPRCSDYKTEFREVIKLENVTRTRTIRFCCDGYAGITSVNETVCKPICRGGCGRGYCRSPNECSCDAGYAGKHCTQRCSHDRWGEGCKNVCRCLNQSVCDNKSGICHCTSGWTGEACELPCPQGTHGIMCKKTCECSSNRCNPQTGECLADEILPANVTSSMIESLNSTIVNITQNLDRIAKNLVTTETVTLLVPDTILEITTPKAVQEVILIKPPGDNPTPSIIVHQPGGGVKTPEVIHVITNWQKDQLTGIGDTTLNETRLEAAVPSLDHESRLLTILLVVLLCIMIVLSVGFLVIYKKFNFKRRMTSSATEPDGDHSVGPKPFTKPLPDLPAFTQNMQSKIEGPEFYDSPSNNGIVKPPYCYARKESLYSVVPKSRKGSLDSHLYDEIRYPAAHKISHM